MDVSVVVCVYSMDRFESFVEAVESVLAQTYDPIEAILVVDGNQAVYERVADRFGDRDDVVVHCNEENRGVSVSRTHGAELASGDVVAFIDDDAVAEPDWIEHLVEAYEKHDAVAVGGRMTGEWLAGRPSFLPDEFDWLVGVTHRGFADGRTEVRNTFESNISFRREVFLDLGGFDPELGPTGEEYRHSEGAEIGARLEAEYDRGVMYIPEAIVRHKVFEHRTRLSWLCRRAFEQGVSKRAMKRRTDGSSAEEFGFLRSLFLEHLPRRLRELIDEPSVAGVAQIVMLFVFTGLVGVGYLFESAWGIVSR
ncbi:glycosyltransferase AglG [Natronomonas pharaonis DSM 2160]|uniref:Glycosyltransferase AglG n=1 Tax=Natronomonas pharaonis (strain ATCC 35678 / DSM 2160 / CIP 103997 / JCM 8858 / NBRC 14720 / NCIMB 2260 / Gabara) TaxID=348780 RepID=A0A1U7EVK4_NATPD|nr:glucosyl-dolichyl phosphate glucuronosyltransferase [Natronomonas pharaonis]CAI49049.1 glycosyltransferase AglG [Natronomonas pharaonis DSM 2160]